VARRAEPHDDPRGAPPERPDVARHPCTGGWRARGRTRPTAHPTSGGPPARGAPPSDPGLGAPRRARDRPSSVAPGPRAGRGPDPPAGPYTAGVAPTPPLAVVP